MNLKPLDPIDSKTTFSFILIKGINMFINCGSTDKLKLVNE